MDTPVHLVVTGRSNTATYDTAVTESGCRYGFALNGTHNAEPCSKLRVVVQDTNAPATQTCTFDMTVTFAPTAQQVAPAVR